MGLEMSSVIHMLSTHTALGLISKTKHGGGVGETRVFNAKWSSIAL